MPAAANTVETRVSPIANRLFLAAVYCLALFLVISCSDEGLVGQDPPSGISSSPSALALIPALTIVAAGDDISFSHTGGEGPYTFSMLANNSGATLDVQTGAYVAGSTGSVVDTIVVTDKAGATATAMVTVNAALAISPSSKTVAAADRILFSETGGVGPFTYSISTNHSGGSIDASTGAYTAGATGGVIDTIRVTDSLANISSATVTVNPALAISPSSTALAVGNGVTFSKTGGVGPFTFSLASNDSGATIDANTGAYTAGATGGVTDTVRVTDSLMNTSNATVTVNAALAISPSSDTVVTGAGISFSASGGVPSYTYSLLTNSSGGSISGLGSIPRGLRAELRIQ